jgi:hypothetical protein
MRNCNNKTIVRIVSNYNSEFHNKTISFIDYQDDQVSDGLQPDRQPTVRRESGIVTSLVQVHLSFVLRNESEQK